MTDSELLIHYARRRDAEAFASLVRRHGAMVYGVCLRVLGNDADASDAAQEAFVALARRAGEVRENVAAYLHGCAAHCAAKLLRRRLAQTRRDRAAATLRSECGDGEEWPQVRRAVDEALAALGDSDRQLIVEHFYECRSQQAIADAAGVSQSLVSRRIKAAVGRLRRQLARVGIRAGAATLLAGLATESAVAIPVELTRHLTAIGLSGVTASTTPAVALTGSILMKSKIAAAVAAILLLAGAGTGVVFITKHARIPQAQLAAKSMATNEPNPLQPELEDGQFGCVLRPSMEATNASHLSVMHSELHAKAVPIEYLISIPGTSFWPTRIGNDTDVDLKAKYDCHARAPLVPSTQPGNKTPLGRPPIHGVVWRAIESELGVVLSIERRRVPVLLLKLGPDGTHRLKTAPPTRPPASGPSARFTEYGSMSLDIAAMEVEESGDIPVVNETGLPGHFDFGEPQVGQNIVEWIVDRNGLRLERAEREIEMIVVRPAPKPTDADKAAAQGR
jgi:RNA polymerase sigma factor (sigma-70 family)